MNDKQNKIVSMFDSIASRYDIANRVLSMGVDKSWRDKAVKQAYHIYNKKQIDSIVDVACGTGDLMLYWQKVAVDLNIKLHRIVGIDPSVKMMEVGKNKVANAEFIEGFAQNLPLDNSQTNILSIAYGIRNVTHRAEAFEEFSRVLKPQGLLVILEFTKEENKTWFSDIKRFYMTKIMPYIGKVVSGHGEAYQYLPDSIDEFVTTKQLQSELEEVGFEIVFAQDYSMGMNTTIIAKNKKKEKI
jgi:demethylmenaquinone methyltransferase/2-methoxy-6-polyprenyl-1,4-benzoquinol methylase